MIYQIMELMWITHLLLAFISIYLTVTNGQPHEQQKCPDRCRCAHFEGRLTANCSNTRLNTIPGPLPERSMIVQFDQNPFGDSTWLQKPKYFLLDKFAKDWLELSLRSCNISSFKVELFWGLENLVKLNLAKNKLTKIPTIADQNGKPGSQESPFKDMVNLKVLDLSSNKLTIISRRNFEGAIKLEQLDLSNNEIKFIHNEAFNGLPYLQTIDLTKNQLTLVTRLTFSHLSHLKHLHLFGNPFDCDCRLRDFVAWQNDKYIVQPPKCTSPEKLRDKPWNHLNLNEFACAPRLTPGGGGKKAVININNVGAITSLSCRVTGVPEPKMIWEFHNATQTVIIQLTKYKYELSKSNLSGCPYYEPPPTPSPATGCTWVHTLKIFSVSASDAGVYHCKANNLADTQYLVFQLDLDRGQIVQHVTGNGKGSGHLERIVNPMGDDAKSGDTTSSVEKSDDTSSNGNILMISLIIGATILVIIALMLAVLCYRRALNKHRHSSHHMQGNGGLVTGTSTSGTFKPKAVNGYGYHIIDNGAGATSPASLGLGDASATTSLRSPTTPAALAGVNPVEKPPRTHLENFYTEEPSASNICDYHRQQMEQQRRHIQQRQPLDDSRTGLIHAECDDSGFSDPSDYYQQRYATLPSQRSAPSHVHSGSRTPGQRILRPAIDDPLLEKKLLLMRRNSDGGQGNGGCCGHGHSAVTLDDKRTLSPFAAQAYDKTELRETAL